MYSVQVFNNRVLTTHYRFLRFTTLTL